MPKLPNILFIMADQMAAPVLPFYRPANDPGPVLSPHLNALAAEGIVFDNAYCNSPLCAPSRYVLMSGQLPTKIGAYDNAADFAADIPTYAHYLRAHGYKTALSGKMHFCGPDQLHGFEERLTSDIYPADYGWFPDWDNFEERPTWYHNMSSVTQAGTCVRSNQLDFDDEVQFQAKRFLGDTVRSNDTRPFCLTVSFTHPHDPYATPQEYWDRYAGVEIPMPKVQRAGLMPDPHAERLRFVYQTDAQTLTEQMVMNARRAYFGSISYVDDQIGELVKLLKDLQLYDDTIIVFSGDHGDMLGERGLWYKMNWYEWSARVPLLVHAPKHFSARRVSEAVSTLDLLPTFVELAVGEGEHYYASPVQGRSLLPHIKGEGGHDEVIGEYCGEGCTQPLMMIRRGKFKFICCEGDPDQLYDLTVDPDELTNLALVSNDEQSAEVRSALQSFREEAMQRWDMQGIRESVVQSQRRRRFVAKSLTKGKVTAWDHQPFFDASSQYMRNHMDLDDLEKRARFPEVK